MYARVQYKGFFYSENEVKGYSLHMPGGYKNA